MSAAYIDLATTLVNENS